MAFDFDAGKRLQPKKPAKPLTAARGLIWRIDSLEAVEIVVGKSDPTVCHGEGFDRSWLCIIKIALPVRHNANEMACASSFVDRLERIHDCFEERKEGLRLRQVGVADSTGDACSHDCSYPFRGMTA